MGLWVRGWLIILREATAFIATMRLPSRTDVTFGALAKSMAAL